MTAAPPPAPRWLSFDCYGTLIDWKAGLRRSFRESARVCAEEEEELVRTWEGIQREKMQGAYSPYARILQDSFRETLEQFGYHCATHATESFLNSVARWEPFPDVNPALMRLAQRYKLAIITNADRDMLGWTLRRFQIRFDALITAEDARLYNPNPEVFRYALGRVHCTPEEMAYVVCESEANFEAAASVGVRIVYVARHAPLGNSAVPVEAAIANLSELSALWR